MRRTLHIIVMLVCCVCGTAQAQQISPLVDLSLLGTNTSLEGVSLNPSPGSVAMLPSTTSFGMQVGAGGRAHVGRTFLSGLIGARFSQQSFAGDTVLLTRDPNDASRTRLTNFMHELEVQRVDLVLQSVGEIPLWGNLALTPSLAAVIPVSLSLDETERAQDFEYTSGSSSRTLATESDIAVGAVEIVPSLGLAYVLGDPDGLQSVLHVDCGTTLAPVLPYSSQFHVQAGVRLVFGSPESAVEVPLPEQEERSVRYDTLALVRDTVIKRIPGVNTPELILDTVVTTVSRSYTESEIIHTVSSVENYVWQYPEIRPLLAAGISTKFVLDDGTEVSSARISIEEFIDNRHVPLLSYVFFEPRSVTLAPRYVSRNKQRIKFYDPSQLFGVDNLSVYRDLLNIIGYRMSREDSSTLVVSGYVSPADDGGIPSVASRRARRIGSYLVETFGIDSSRISFRAGQLPPDASPETDPDGRAENRRVELSSTNAPHLFDPLSISDTLRVMDPPNVQFHVSAIAEAGIATWELRVEQGKEVIFTRSGEGSPPASIQWRANEERNAPLLAEELSYVFTVVDSTGQMFVTNTDTLAFKEVTVAKKRKEEQRDKILDRYALILFDFDSGKLTEANRSIVAEVKSKILPTSKVSVIGSTDRMGNEAHNKVLSFERARRAANALGLPEISAKGIGEDTTTYDNDTPEGRFYSRAVYILIETPVQ